MSHLTSVCYCATLQHLRGFILTDVHDAGKTTFIKHLLGREYPGIHIGPEPTTDRFVVVMGGMEERRTPGNTLIVQPDKPYQACLPSLRTFPF